MSSIHERRNKLGRAASGPEHNLVQNPALTRAIQQAVGMKQAHISPVLGEVIQPVIVVTDLREDPNARPFTFIGFRQINADGINSKGYTFSNPSGSGVICSLRSVNISYNAVGLGNLWWQTRLYAGQAPVAGARMLIGRGNPSQTDPLTTKQTTVCGIANYAGATPLIGYAESRNSSLMVIGSEVKYFWGGPSGIPLWVYPGGEVLFSELGNINGSWDVTMKWDEHEGA